MSLIQHSLLSLSHPLQMNLLCMPPNNCLWCNPKSLITLLCDTFLDGSLLIAFVRLSVGQLSMHECHMVLSFDGLTSHPILHSMSLDAVNQSHVTLCILTPLLLTMVDKLLSSSMAPNPMSQMFMALRLTPSSSTPWRTTFVSVVHPLN